MRFALVNPPWEFGGSIYFGCREPHFPLEFAYAAARLRAAGHEALIVDGHFFHLQAAEIAARVAAFRPDFVVLTTAPSYLFWRCPPPELREPLGLARLLRQGGGRLVVVGPHGSATPGAVLDKLAADLVVRGEFEDLLPSLAGPDWRSVPGTACRAGGTLHLQGGPGTADLHRLPLLEWPTEWIVRHRHQHHRFDAPGTGPGAEVEASRGCPYQCLFCAKENFRGVYRRRPLSTVLREIDLLLRQGVEYVYFVDEIFLPDRVLLTALAERRLTFGIQTRIDLWSGDQLALLGRAGCVSIEAGIESLSAEGRRRLGKPSRLQTDTLTQRLEKARRHVPFVQANLLATGEDDAGEVARWRQQLIERGIWANDPVPLFPYPGSGAYRQKWGDPDDSAWERAHAWYLASHPAFSDLQDAQPLPLPVLEQAEALHA